MITYKIISETEKAIKVKYPYYHKISDNYIQKYKTLWIPKFVLNKGSDYTDKFVSAKIEADIKLLPLVFQRQVLSWYVGVAPITKIKK